MKQATALLLGVMLVSSAPLALAQPSASKPPLDIEESDTAALPKVSAHWIFTQKNWKGGSARIFDGDTGKMLGQLHLSELANAAMDPQGRYYYVVETIWTKGTRGARQDFLTVRDGRTLNVVREIPLPGRLLVGNRKFTLGISADGRQAFVYNMDPASSVIVVDLVKNRVAGAIEVPGCALAVGFGKDASLSLCSDGSATLASLGGGKNGQLKISNPFFSAEKDPVFDNFAVNSVTADATFISYSGKIVSASLSGALQLSDAWSVQETAGYAPGSIEPLAPNWYPGGRQPLAYSKAADRIYVLMHMGEFWSQKQPAEEVWVLQASTRKLLKRVKLPAKIDAVEVSQDDKPLLYLSSEETLYVWDAVSLEPRNEIEEAGDGLLWTPVAGW